MLRLQHEQLHGCIPYLWKHEKAAINKTVCFKGWIHAKMKIESLSTPSTMKDGELGEVLQSTRQSCMILLMSVSWWQTSDVGWRAAGLLITCSGEHSLVRLCWQTQRSKKTKEAQMASESVLSEGQICLRLKCECEDWNVSRWLWRGDSEKWHFCCNDTCTYATHDLIERRKLM